MPVNWDTITRAECDALCESLVRREHRAARVRVFDGAGGDGGRDVVVTDAGSMTIFQLKHFPGRIPARNPNRRSQVEASLKAAARHDLVRWVLVVPTKLNQHEHAWFDRLAGTVPFDVDLWDTTALNDACARNADLVVQHMRSAGDYLLEAAREFNVEKAVLAGGSADLTERVAALGHRAEEQDPDWRWDFTYAGGTVVNTLVAKHTGSAEVSPISIGVELAFPPDEAGQALLRQWTAATQYGAPGTVELPAGTVTRFTVEGPPLVAGEHETTALQFVAQPLAVPAQPARLRVSDGSGVVLHDLRGRTERWGSGARGHHVRSTIGGLLVDITLDAGPEGRGNADLDLDLARCDSPEEALAAVRAALDLKAPHLLELDVHPFSVRVPLPQEGMFDVAALRRAEQVMQDLVNVGRHLDLLMPVPRCLSGTEIQELRLAARLLAGDLVEVHRGPVTATLNGQDSPVLQDILGGRVPGAFLVRRDHEVTVAGRVLTLRQVAMYTRAATVVASASTRKALRQGNGAGRTLTVHPASGEAWLAKRVRDLGEVDLRQEPSPLGLLRADAPAP